MRQSPGHKLDAAFLLAAVLVLTAAAVAYRDARSLAATAEAIARDEDALGAAERARSSLAEAVAAARGLRLTGETRFRRSLQDAANAMHLAAYRLDVLAGSDSALRRPARELVAMSATLLPDLVGSAAAAEDRTATAPAKRARDAIDRVVASERANLLTRGFAARAAARRAGIVTGLALLVALILVPLAYAMLRRELAARRGSARALAASESRFRAAMDGGLDAFYILRSVRGANDAVTDFEFVELNSRAEALLGLERDQVLGRRLCELVLGNRSGGFLERYVRVIETGRVLEEEFEVTAPELPAAWIRQQVIPVDDGVAISSRDVTERHRNDEALRALSLVDDLTGLYNRRGFLTLARQQLKLARRGHRELLLLFVDMDDFKSINDTFGHHEGDVALTRAAAVLRKTFRDSDIVARIGGDEFVILATDSPRAARETVITRLRAELRERNGSDGYPYTLSFSIGVAHFDPMRPPTIDELLSTADEMLYEQKKRRAPGAVSGSGETLVRPVPG